MSLARTGFNVNAIFFFSLPVFMLYLELVAHSTLSAVRMDGDIPAEMRGGEGSSKGASRWPGRMGTEKKRVSGLIVPLMSLQAVTPLCGTPHYPSVRGR